MDNRSHRSLIVKVEVLRAIFRVTSWVPLAWLLWLYSFTLTGPVHMQVLSKLDPKFLEFDEPYYCVLLLQRLNSGGLALWLALYAAFKVDKVPVPPGTKVFLLGLLLTLIHFTLDPFHILVSYWD